MMTSLKKVVTSGASYGVRGFAMKNTWVLATSLVLLTAISGCDRRPSDGRGLLERLSNRGGPDELATVPQKPLEAPSDFSALPEPTPGTANRADLTPDIDIVVALTGSPPRNAGAAAGDAAFVASILARAGSAPDDGFNLLGLFGGRTDFLDARAELARLRALGVRTPAAPPAN